MRVPFRITIGNPTRLAYWGVLSLGRKNLSYLLDIAHPIHELDALPPTTDPRTLEDRFGLAILSEGDIVTLEDTTYAALLEIILPEIREFLEEGDGVRFSRSGTLELEGATIAALNRLGCAIFATP